jgi:hypothetical protein
LLVFLRRQGAARHTRAGVFSAGKVIPSAEQYRAPRLKREIHRFNDELKRKNFPRRAAKDCFLARMASTECREAPPARRKGGPRGLSAVLACRDSSTARRALSSEIVQTQGTRLNKISLARGQRLFLQPDGPSDTKYRRSRRGHPDAARVGQSPQTTARPALGAIQLFCSWQNSMNRPGARTGTVGRRKGGESVFSYQRVAASG